MSLPVIEGERVAREARAAGKGQRDRGIHSSREKDDGVRELWHERDGTDEDRAPLCPLPICGVRTATNLAVWDGGVWHTLGAGVGTPLNSSRLRNEPRSGSPSGPFRRWPA